MTTTTDPGGTRGPSWLRRRTVRTRMLGWLLLVATLGMALAGAASYVVQRNLVDARIDRSLQQEVEELRTFARTGVDPATGQPFDSLESLFYAALQRNVPDENEAFLTLVGGEVVYFSPGRRPVRLQDLPPVVEAAAAVGPDDDARIATVATAVGDIRYAAVPVLLDGASPGRHGVYVVGIGRDLEQAQVAEASRTFTVVALASLALVALLGWVVTGRLLAPVRALGETAQRITDTDLDERIPVTGHDDLSELARTVNGMLDRLQHALATQRDLLDDVGHELRTPVTVLRGHLELLDAADPTEVAETRALLLDELDRMNRLVEDLLTLAKARRPDFLRQQVVDVDDLLDDVLVKARGLGRRRWVRDARSSAVLTADPQRLTQALLQLAANAAGHTVEDDEIGLGSAQGEGVVRLWVRDTGPGVADADRDRIFDRFERGTSTRGQDGSGLGLTIVTAIAEAHGGRVELDSEPGHGATFSIVLNHPGPRPLGDTMPLPEADAGNRTAAPATGR